MSSVDKSLLHPGTTIYYLLLPCQLPTNPQKEWAGRILQCHIGMPGSLDVALVESLEPGYTPDTEFVLLDQITRIG